MAKGIAAVLVCLVACGGIPVEISSSGGQEAKGDPTKTPSESPRKAPEADAGPDGASPVEDAAAGQDGAASIPPATPPVVPPPVDTCGWRREWTGPYASSPDFEWRNTIQGGVLCSYGNGDFNWKSEDCVHPYSPVSFDNRLLQRPNDEHWYAIFWERANSRFYAQPIACPRRCAKFDGDMAAPACPPGVD